MESGIQQLAEADALLLQRADAARTYGDDDRVPTIDEFVDFACPDCSVFHAERGDSLINRFVIGAGVNYRVRMYLIPRLMRGYQAAEAAYAAGALEGRSAFEGMMRLLLEHQEEWRYLLDPTPHFEEYARYLELPLDRFRELLERDAMAPLILSDIRMAQAMGVTGAPTFVFNRPGELTGEHSFYGNQPMSLFADYLERVGFPPPR